jgi:hypothetical protein
LNQGHAPLVDCVGKGLGMLKKGAAIELKNFDFTIRFYKDDPGRAVAPRSGTLA